MSPPARSEGAVVVKSYTTLWDMIIDPASWLGSLVGWAGWQVVGRYPFVPTPARARFVTPLSRPSRNEALIHKLPAGLPVPPASRRGHLRRFLGLPRSGP